MLTFKERRKRVDSKQIIADMDNLENSFLLKSEKLNEKRSAQLKKRMAKLLPELEKKFEEGKLEEVERTLETLQLPSSKEWGKLIYQLVDASARAGVLRAHLEVMRLRELYEFAEGDISARITEGRTTFEVNFPKEADEYLRKYGYEIGAITEETVRQRIRDVTLDGLHKGIRGRDLTRDIYNVTDTWVSQSHADTIARTETAKMYNAGRVARWLDPEQNGFVEALQYDSIVDTRTTELCKELDGKIVSVTNAAAIAEMTPPNHFKCRATWIPVTRYEDWTDDFPTDLEAQKGFTFESPLPRLIARRVAKTAAPLVTSTVTTAAAATITDPLVIRTLTDEDFREAIGNITDLDMKYFLIKERAQQMAAQAGLVSQKVGTIELTGGIYSDDMVRMKLGKGFKEFVFPANKAIQPELADLMEELGNANNDWKAINAVIEKFISKNSSDPDYLNAIIGLKKFQKQQLRVTVVDPTAFTLQKSTPESLKALTIKRPPMRGNYKNALQLQQHTDFAEDWLKKYVHPKGAPDSVTLRFNVNNRRAYALPAKSEIHFGTNGRSGVVVHEIGHLMHDHNKAIEELINKFFMRRTDNLRLPTSNRMGEKVIKDDFFSSYIGRIYGWENADSYGQEVYSMGIQAMHEDPQEFFEKDPEHFYFTLAIMEGLF